MENNYFIKSSYTSNKEIKTIDTDDTKYWNNPRIIRIFYTRYYLFKSIRRLIKKLELKSVLDIGCGPATKLIKFFHPLCQDIYGIDQEYIIEKNIKLYGLKTFYTDDFENPKLDLQKKFDVIICTDVIEHLFNPNKLLEYIKKYCYENTYIIITTPERDILRGSDCDYSPHILHIREWNMQEFNNYLTYEGFIVLFHDIIENYKINHIFKNFFKYEYTNIRDFYHCQLAICKLKSGDESKYLTLNKIFGPGIMYYIRKFINHWFLKFSLILFKIYKLGERIGLQRNVLLRNAEKITINL